MNKEALVQELGKIVGADRVSDSEQAVLDAAKDYIGYRRYERDDKKYWVPRAACVVHPQSTEQVAEVLKYLNDKKLTWCREPAAPALPAASSPGRTA